MRALILAIAVLLAASARLAAAEPARFGEGERVLPKPGAQVTDGDETIDSDRFSVPWIIQAVEGERLLVGDNRKGWVERSQVVLLKDAPVYYAQFINSKQFKSKQHKAWACYYRAVAWQEGGDLISAIAGYDEAIGLDSNRASAYVARGSAWEAKQDNDKAIADFREALRLDPSHPLAHDELAAALEARGRARADGNQYDLAIADLSEAIRIAPNEKRLLNYRGWAWTKKKDFAKAMADYEEAIRCDPEDRSSLNNAAWLKATCPDQRFRNGRQAVELATKANDFLVEDSFAWLDTLAAAHAEAGDFDAAVRIQAQAIEMNPKDEEFVKGAKERLALYENHKPYRED
jgi:tetratricopeptide (TPR) repeat protein